MQPRPRAETSKLLFPGLRFCMVAPSTGSLTCKVRAQRPEAGIMILFIGADKKRITDARGLTRWQPRLAPHQGSLYSGAFGGTAKFSRQAGEPTSASQFVLGFGCNPANCFS